MTAPFIALEIATLDYGYLQNAPVVHSVVSVECGVY